MNQQLLQATAILKNALYNYGRILIFNSPYKTKFTTEILQSYLVDFVTDEIIHGRIIAEVNLNKKLEA